MTLGGDIVYEDQLKYDVRAVKSQKTQFPQCFSALDKLRFVTNFRGLVDFRLKLPHHSRIALDLGNGDAFLKYFNRARYVALAEESSGLTKDASVALTFSGGIHEDYRK